MAAFGDRFRGRRVLVTGHTGFKGSWLCAWLEALGARVAGFALAPATDPHHYGMLDLRLEQGETIADLRDAAALRDGLQACQPELVLHLAAQPLVRASYDEPKATFDVNVGGTVNLLEAVRCTPSVQACVVVTSDKCYENQEWVWGYRENDPMGGHDPYSASKGAAELVTASYRRSFFASGCALASARAGNVIGGGDWSADRLVVDFIRAMASDEPLRLRYPQATRPWQHVLEPLSGYLALADRLLSADGQSWAQAWNFGPQDAGMVCVRDLAEALVAAWGSGRVDLSGAQEQPHEAGLLTLDCSKARQRLGWHGVLDVPTTVDWTVDWYRRQLAGEAMAAITHQQIADYQAAAAARGLAWASEE